MRCHSPYFSAMSGAYACGRCAACTSSRRRTWAGRLILESYSHPRSTVFVTLTYERERYSLSIRDCQLFFKKLRKFAKVRYLYCGEYGDTSFRPHYHAIIFGLPECRGTPVVYAGGGFYCRCDTCELVRRTWGHGFTSVGNFSERRAMYITGYVAKKMTHRLDPRLEGREPEFARMSLSPGIGRPSIGKLSELIRTYNRTIPGGYELGGRLMPIGRYLRRSIARDLSDGNVQVEKALLGVADTVSKSQAAMRLLRAYAWSVEKPVDKVWKEVLGIEAQNLVIPDFPTIHRTTEAKI